jgi:pimeloyl-ACP methyl ester carboxylesterase
MGNRLAEDLTMEASLDLFLATDGLWLPGLLYKPEKPSKKVMVWLHGMGDSAVFYSPARINALAEALAENNIALFAFNNRGAHNAKTLKQQGGPEAPEEEGRYQAGTYYELIKDCVKDIDGALGFLRSKGFTEFYLAGHSTGANKICIYDHYKKDNPFSKYVLAGPGDDTGIAFSELGEKKFWNALKYAGKALSIDPLKIMPKYSGMYPFSAQSAHDILDPDGDYNTFPFYEDVSERLGSKPLFKEYKAIEKPTLVIFGREDEYTFTAGNASSAVDIFIKHTTNAMLKKIDFRLVDNADHGFTGCEAEFASSVADWLSRG